MSVQSLILKRYYEKKAIGNSPEILYLGANQYFVFLNELVMTYHQPNIQGEFKYLGMKVKRYNKDNYIGIRCKESRPKKYSLKKLANEFYNWRLNRALNHLGL